MSLPLSARPFSSPSTPRRTDNAISAQRSIASGPALLPASLRRRRDSGLAFSTLLCRTSTFASGVGVRFGPSLSCSQIASTSAIVNPSSSRASPRMGSSDQPASLSSSSHPNSSAPPASSRMGSSIPPTALRSPLSCSSSHPPPARALSRTPETTTERVRILDPASYCNPGEFLSSHMKSTIFCRHVNSKRRKRARINSFRCPPVCFVVVSSHMSATDRACNNC